MKFDPKNYDIYLRDDMQKVEDAYEEYKADENNEKKYFELKQAIYNLSLSIKAQTVSGWISPSDAEEMKEYLSGNLCRCTGYMGQMRAIRHYVDEEVEA